MNKRLTTGLTLVEMLVVISIISVLAVFVISTLTESTAQSRDAERQADIRNIQSAIELYRQENGRYPEGCNGPNSWSGEPGSIHECASGQYITGLAPKYIRTLPADPAAESGQDEGYAYMVNSAGTVYRFMIRNTVETEVVDWNHPLKSCQADFGNDNLNVCNRVAAEGNSLPAWCNQNNAQFRTSYAVWGGFDSSTNNPILNEQRTEQIYCVE